jgi:glycosyltransferase involved in cell wall biosynthesis
MPSIDVIVPCYNYGHFLRTCVESALNQEGIETRVLILDDSSQDNTGEVAEQLAQDNTRVTVIRHAANRGHIATYNEGIEWCSADYLLLLSADDYVLPGAFARAVALMDSRPEVGFTFGAALLLDSETGITRLDCRVRCPGAARIMAGTEFIRESKAICLVNTPTAIVRTKLQKAVGGYRPDLPHSGDVEMWLRLSANAGVGYIKEPQAVYRVHSANMSLGYYADLGLRDFRQRSAAFKYFLADYGSTLPRALQRRVNYYLSYNALDLASLSWELGRDETNELVDFARKHSHLALFSPAYVRFVLKRVLGVTAYSKLRSFRRLIPRSVNLPIISR